MSVAVALRVRNAISGVAQRRSRQVPVLSETNGWIMKEAVVMWRRRAPRRRRRLSAGD
jgi:hypothetical protein